MFAEDGVLELPWIQVRVQGPEAINRLITGLLAKVPDFALATSDSGLTPDRTFAEHALDAEVVASGKPDQQNYAGLLLAERGRIKLLREVMNTAAAAEAIRLS